MSMRSIDENDIAANMQTNMQIETKEYFANVASDIANIANSLDSNRSALSADVDAVLNAVVEIGGL